MKSIEHNVKMMCVLYMVLMFLCLTFVTSGYAGTDRFGDIPLRMKMTTDIPETILTPDTVQTRLGPLEYFDGYPKPNTVKKVYGEEKVAIKKELYLSIMLDRTRRMPLIMIINEGGMDIEGVPDEKIFKEWISPLIGIQSFNLRNLVSKLNLEKED